MAPNKETPDPAPSAPSTPTSLSTSDLLASLTRALEQIALGQQDARIAAQSALDQAHRATQPDNKDSPRVSVFNPQGDTDFPRPRLKCPMFIPWQADEDSLSYEEIELLNLLVPGDYTVARNDGTKVKITVRATFNADGSMDRLLMNHEVAFNNDYHWLMPPLTTVLRSIGRQSDRRSEVSKIMTMEDRELAVASGSLPVSAARR